MTTAGLDCLVGHPHGQSARFPDAPLPRATWRDAVLVLAVAGALLIWRRETLLLPGYQDQAAGYWTEAKYLADSSFDYYSLRYVENHYMDVVPGPRCYMISVLPTILAALMKTGASTPTLLAIVRTASFLCGAVVIVLLFRVARTWAGSVGAAAVCAIYATLPLFSTQLEIMGMDVFLTPFLMTSLILLMRHRFQAAGIWAAIAFLVKASGMLAVLVAVGYLAILLVVGWRRVDGAVVRKLAKALAFNIGLLAVLWLVVAWGDTSFNLRSSYPWPRISKPPYSIVTQTPELGLLAIVAGVFSVARFVAGWNRQPKGEPRWFSTILWERVNVISWISLVGLVAASGLYLYMARYVFCVVPMVFVILSRSAFSPAIARWSYPSSLAIVVFNLVNTDGRFYPPVSLYDKEAFDRIPGLTLRLCVFQERSREYLRDHRSNLAGVKLLEEKYASHPIFTPVPYLFMMRNPAAGYVTRPLRTYDATVFQTAIQQFLDLYASPSSPPPKEDPIFLYYGDSRISVPLREPGDTLLYDDGLDPPLVIYRKHLPPEIRGNRPALERWYLEKTWANTLPVLRFTARAPYLVEHGYNEEFERELNEALALHPSEPRLEAWRGRSKQTRLDP